MAVPCAWHVVRVRHRGKGRAQDPRLGVHRGPRGGRHAPARGPGGRVASGRRRQDGRAAGGHGDGVDDLEPEAKEQPVNGVYRLTLAGEVELLTERFVRPNGLAFGTQWARDQLARGWS